MNEYTITYTADITVIRKTNNELLPKEEIIENIVETCKDFLEADDVHIKNFKVFPTGSGDVND